MKVLTERKNGQVADLMLKLKGKVLNRVNEMDLSYVIILKAAYPNLEFLRRDRLQTKQKDYMKHIEEYLHGKR